MHALRKFIFFANEGKIRQSQDDAQTNQAGSLDLMTNAVVTWNTVYMQQVINQLKAEGYPINEADLKYLSPARHVHINPYGHTWSEVGTQISALLSGGYKNIEAAKQATKSASQGVLHCIVSANCDGQYLYREP